MFMDIRYTVKTAGLFLVLAANLCSCQPRIGKPSAAGVEHLIGFMTGSFDSSEQAARDSSYFNISLHMYPIWESREGHWLYVEQALASMQEKPYRQRIYKVEEGPKGGFVSRVFTLSREEECIGKWKTPAFFDAFGMEDVIEKEGCEVYLERTADGYSGKTGQQTCESNLRGASFASSEVTITKGQIHSWDQGWDAEGKQVWGATKGGYIFKKLD